MGGRDAIPHDEDINGILDSLNYDPKLLVGEEKDFRDGVLISVGYDSKNRPFIQADFDGKIYGFIVTVSDGVSEHHLRLYETMQKKRSPIFIMGARMIDNIGVVFPRNIKNHFEEEDDCGDDYKEDKVEFLGDLVVKKDLTTLDGIASYFLNNKETVYSLGGKVRIKNNRVYYLDLSKKGLDFIPDSIGRLDSLNILNLSDNFLKSLPCEIGDLYLLQRLDLSKNRLVNLTGEVGNLQFLKHLDIGYNPKLEHLPESLLNLKCLEELVFDQHLMGVSHDVLEKIQKRGVKLMHRFAR